jgi:osmotically-inducible protein OsmY
MHMKDVLNFVTAMVAGAAAMYYFDPQLGRRRRALLRDKMASRQRNIERYAWKSARRASDRVRGVAAEARASAVKPSEPIPDSQLAARVRSEMGRCVSRPGVVDVSVSNGHVRLGGQIPAHERRELIATVKAINGVNGVDDQMRVYDPPVVAAEASPNAGP